MRRGLQFIIRIVVIISGFLFTFNLPYLLGIENDRITVRVQAFGSMLKEDLHALLQLKDPKYLESLKVLPIAENYQYTMTLLAASLLVVFLLAMLTSILVLHTPGKVQNWLKNFINFFEAVPDLLVIFLLQFLVILLLKKTGLRIFELYGIFGAKPYFVPIVTVSFLPFFLLVQFLIKVMTEERNQLYVVYLRAKGIGMVRILLVHIFRNILPLLFLQMRTVVWVILANIYLVEYMFNLNGFTKIFQKILFPQKDVPSLIVCLIMFAIPLVAVEAIGLLLTRRLNGKETARL